MEDAGMSAVAPVPLLRIISSAREDSLVAAYSLLVVVPLSTLVSRWLLRRGLKTTQLQVLLCSIAVPALLIGVPAVYEWIYGYKTTYRLLDLSRTESVHSWGRKYAYWHNLYRKGEMPQDVWTTIDQAYDYIYTDTARFLYDFWGPEAKGLSLLETQCNVGLFYLLWGGIIFALTTPKATASASSWSFSGLLALFCLEMSVRLMYYDPVKAWGVLTFLTPREVLQWLHRLFPVFIVAVVAVERVFYVDMDLHQQQLLRNMADKNQRTTVRLTTIAEEIKAEHSTETDADS